MNKSIMGIERGTLTRILKSPGYGTTTLALSISALLATKCKVECILYDLDLGVSKTRIGNILKSMGLDADSKNMQFTLINKQDGVVLEKNYNESCNGEDIRIIIMDSAPLLSNYKCLTDDYLKLVENNIKDTNIAIIITDYNRQGLRTNDKGVTESYYHTPIKHEFVNEIKMLKTSNKYFDISINDERHVLNRLDNCLFDKEQLSDFIDY